MAKLEIPSIVVQSGTHSPPKMDRASRSRQWSMSQQSTCDEDCELEVGAADPEEQQAPQPQDITAPAPAQNNNILTRSRSKSSLKLLKRSQAVNESTSPPPDLPPSPVSVSFPPTTSAPTSLPNNNNNNVSTTVNNNKRNSETLAPNTRPTIKREGSNQSCDSNRSGHLSRGNSCDQSTEVSVEKWISDKINSSKKDCSFMLKLESDILNLIKDPKKCSLKYDPLPAYQRMIVHKCSEYWGLEHNTIKESMMVISKPKNYAPIERKISDLIDRDFNLTDEEPRRSILKRDSASFEESLSFKSPDRHSVDAPRRSKSFEEREEEYEKVRRRIFQPEHQMNGNGNNYMDKGRPQWPQVTNSWLADSSKLHPGNIPVNRKLRKNESYESNELLKANSLRQTTTINKAHSFGGYDDPATTNNRVLTKQDSGSSVSSRVSPGSSGYKSLRSDATISATPSPTATPHLTTQLSSQSEVSPDPEGEAVVWAVTSINSVPIGSVLINPQTGLPLVNADGSVYHFDPANPPNLQMDPDNRISRRTPSTSREEEDTLARSHNHLQSDSSTPTFTDTNQGEVIHNSMVPPPAHHNIPSPSSSAPAVPAAPTPAHIMPYSIPQQMTPTYNHPLSYPGATTSLMYSPPYTTGMPAAASEQYGGVVSAANLTGAPLMYSLPSSQYSSLPISQAPASYDRSHMPMENAQHFDAMRLMMAGLNISETRTRPLFVAPGQQPPYGPPANFPQGFYLSPPSLPTQPPCPAAMPGQQRYSFAPVTDRQTEWMTPMQSYYGRGQMNAGAVGGAPSLVLPYPAASQGYSGVGVVPLPAPPPPRAYHRMSTPPVPPQPTQQFPSGSYRIMVPQYQTPAQPAIQISMPQHLMRTTNQLGVSSPPVRGTQSSPFTTSASSSTDSSLLYMRNSPAQPTLPLITPSIRPILGASQPQLVPQGRAILGASAPLACTRPAGPPPTKRQRAPRPSDVGTSLHHCNSCLNRNAHHGCSRSRRQDLECNPSGKHQSRRN